MSGGGGSGGGAGRRPKRTKGACRCRPMTRSFPPPDLPLPRETARRSKKQPRLLRPRPRSRRRRGPPRSSRPRRRSRSWPGVAAGASWPRPRPPETRLGASPEIGNAWGSPAGAGRKFLRTPTPCWGGWGGAAPPRWSVLPARRGRRRCLKTTPRRRRWWQRPRRRFPARWPRRRRCRARKKRRTKIQARRRHRRPRAGSSHPTRFRRSIPGRTASRSGAEGTRTS
mmetsp:Transcript_30441/g.90883  ORF Transcript_30441/g.90883 Transcript_30441/m.90883 type:complete len:226 (+) Transcript_30441:2139-2816(+)